MTAPSLGPGSVVAGKYSVRALMGHGGASATYQAVTPEGREVALKIYDPAVTQHAAVMQALEQAYAAVNSLPQSSTSPVLDAGYDPQTGAPFSVLEIIGVPSLSRLGRRLSLGEVVTLLSGMAKSLDLAHLRKVVHGALKPTNIFVGPNLSPVVVIDFAANLPKGVVPTHEGYLQMAPWLAPEQLQGGVIDAAADVFSAALVAYYAMTGHSYWRSFQGPSPDLAAWQQELVGERSPASARAAEVGVPLSPAADVALWKALSVNPQERPRSISELASKLSDAVNKDEGNAATQALPAFDDAPSNSSPPTMALASAADLPGAPAMPQGMGAGQAYGAAPQGYGPAQGYGPPQGAGFAHSSSGPHGFPATGYAAPAAPGGQDAYPPPPPVGQHAGMAVPPPVRSRSVVPIVIGVVGIAALAAVTGVWFVRRDKAPSEDVDAPIAIASDAGDRASGDKAAGTAPPDEPKQAEEPKPEEPKQATLRIDCKPAACTSVKVDGKNVDASKPLELEPGTYKVEVARGGFFPQTESIDLAAGKEVERVFDLKPAPAGPAPQPQPQKKCGQFLQRCN